MGASAAATSPLLNTTEASKFLCVSRSKLYELIAQGAIPVIKFGRRTLVTVADLDAFIAEHRSYQTKEARHA